VKPSLIALLTGLVASLALPTTEAAPLLWQDNSLTLLHGDDYAVNPSRQSTVTFEHVSGWRGGDLFLFADFTRFHNGPDAFVGNASVYGEFSPRLSLGKLTERPMKAGPIQDVLLASTLEFGEGDVETALVGPGLDLKLPGFDYFQLNVYRRIPLHGQDGETWQITPVWAMSLPLGASSLVFDGFIDWNVNSDGDYRSNLHFNPQIKYDLGPILGLSKKTLYAGIEYDYWQKKYGLRAAPGFHTDQHTASVLVKMHF